MMAIVANRCSPAHTVSSYSDVGVAENYGMTSGMIDVDDFQNSNRDSVTTIPA